MEIQNKDTSGNFSHSRVYYLASGLTLFTAIIAFHPDASGDIPEVESALATLSLGASPIRAVTARAQGARRPADHDILGRSRFLTARTALFRVPAR